LRAQAWDGSGHYALAQLYDQSVFPDTFGWTNHYFAGVGFPNFYPPLFYFLVSLLRHSHLVSFNVAFKIVLLLPAFLLPSAIAWLTYQLSGRDRMTAACAGFALLPLLVDERFTNSTGVMGLSHTSTFLLGLYTQPLGFLLLIVWYAGYVTSAAPAKDQPGRLSWPLRRSLRMATSAMLLALALLANFFSSNIAAVVVLVGAAGDVIRLWRQRAQGTQPRSWSNRKEAAARESLKRESSAAKNQYESRAQGTSLLSRAFTFPDQTLIENLGIPLLALCLIMFWLMPLASSYRYVVTRPVTTPLRELVPSVMWGWYVLAALGAFLWLRRKRVGPHIHFLVTCGLLFSVSVFGGTFAPRWFPFHSNRLTSTLNFMLAVPVGYTFAAGLRALGFGNQSQAASSGSLSGALKARQAVALMIVLAFLALPVFALIKPTRAEWAFFDQREWARISPLLQFGAEHKDGRYLVENLPFADIDSAHDARAINAYLGAQGNEVLSLFFREAAPNVIFLNPLADSLSLSTDTYGISSTLTDDTEFAKQPLEQHLAQARLFGTKYLVMHSEQMKSKLAAINDIVRHDFGRWTVFDLGAGSQPVASGLSNKPALVVANFSLKERRQNDYDFARLAEEQFASGWYDVMLARSAQTKLDQLQVPSGFGALIVIAYDYNDSERAFANLKALAQTRPLLLFTDHDQLFQKIKASASEFPQVHFINRADNGLGSWIESDHATRSYAESGPRLAWQSIKETLDRTKVAVPTAAFDTKVAADAISLIPAGEMSEAIPVLITTTFHPDWRDDAGNPVYATTPFFMLTFVKRPTRMAFARSTIDRLGVAVSASTLLLLIGYVIWNYRRRR
jgi:hypothetical protein